MVIHKRRNALVAIGSPPNVVKKAEHWVVDKITIEAHSTGGRKDKLTLKGPGLDNYIGIFWKAPEEARPSGPPPMLVKIYKALIKQTESMHKKKTLRDTLKRIQADWSSTPAIELKAPDCSSEPWPPLTSDR